MNKKIINLLLLIAFLFCFLQWPTDSKFVFQIEYDIIFGDHDKTDAFTHPAILLPFIGELFFIAALFVKKPKPWITITGISLCGLLVLMLLFIGIIGPNLKMIGFALPFVILSTFYIVKGRKF